MPCNSDYMYDPPPSVLKTTYDKLLAEHNALVPEADRMREIILTLADAGADVPQDFLEQIDKRQIAHRKVDLKRLVRTFTKAKDAERLALVWAADPNKPLAPQLGFDPDDF